MRRSLLPFVVIAVAPLANARQQSTPRQSGLGQLDREIVALAERVRPALVYVVTTSYAPGATADELLTRQRGSGSGVILDPDGYVVTNAHVVRGARRIQVVLAGAGAPEARSILKAPGRTVGAQLVGFDDETDLAVLRVEQRGLPFLALGDSDELRQGQLVLAFGSPLGLDNSVTLGVVSAAARQLAPEDPMIYVQTDAAINPGNSGGPLVDLEGRVVGINTLIFSQSGGSEGIGFAAPSNIVKNVFGQIRRGGRVRRGEIGVRAQTISPTLAAGLGLARPWGVVLADVRPGGPAAGAGLRIGDLVLTLDAKPMENARQLDVNLYRRAPGSSVTLEVQRGAAKLPFVVTVSERADDPGRFSELVSPERNLVPHLGILAVDLDEKVAGLLPALRARAGVVVAGVDPSGITWRDPLLAGDVIYTLNQETVASVEALRAALSRLGPGAPIVLHVERRGELRYLAFELE